MHQDMCPAFLLSFNVESIDIFITIVIVIIMIIIIIIIYPDIK